MWLFLTVLSKEGKEEETIDYYSKTLWQSSDFFSTTMTNEVDCFFREVSAMEGYGPGGQEKRTADEIGVVRWWRKTKARWESISFLQASTSSIENCIMRLVRRYETVRNSIRRERKLSARKTLLFASFLCHSSLVATSSFLCKDHTHVVFYCYSSDIEHGKQLSCSLAVIVWWMVLVISLCWRAPRFVKHLARDIFPSDDRSRFI